MSAAIHPIFAAALKRFAPPADASYLQEQLTAERDRMTSLLRLPFQLDVSQGQYADARWITAHDDDVYLAVDELIDKHITWLDARVMELTTARREAACMDYTP